jgi:hypothetical protein
VASAISKHILLDVLETVKTNLRAPHEHCSTYCLAFPVQAIDDPTWGMAIVRYA